MLDKGEWVKFRCLVCSRDKLITGFEACYTYGHGLTWAEFRSLIKARCGKEHCDVAVGVALAHEVPKVADGSRKLSGKV